MPNPEAWQEAGDPIRASVTLAKPPYNSIKKGFYFLQ